MWRSKKFIVITLLAILVLGGSLGGVALANTDDEANPPRPRFGGAFLEKVCDIYNADKPDALIDCEALEAAFAEAGAQMREEFLQNRPEIDREAMKEAMLERLQKLYDEGKITDDQFNQMKDRIESAPEDMPFGPGFGGPGGHRGFHRTGGGFPKFGGPCPSPPPAE